jgi:hypothetical protein
MKYYYRNITTGELFSKKEALKMWLENYDGNNAETDIPFSEVFEKTDVSAALAASIFHFNQYSIGTVKEYLKENNVAVRL